MSLKPIIIITSFVEQAYRRLRDFEFNNDTYHKHVQTHVIANARKTLESKHVVLITGKRGSGKTHTALTLLEAMMISHPSMSPVIFDDTFDLNFLNDVNGKVIVIVDNFLGRYGLVDNAISEWQAVWNNVEYLIEQKDIFLILTCTKSYLDEILKMERTAYMDKIIDKIVDCESEIELDGVKGTFSKEERTKLVKVIGKKNHSSFKSSDMERLVSMDDVKYGYPFSCWLVSLGAAALDLEGSIDLFLETHLNEMLNKDVQRYIILVIILVFKGRLNISKFSSADKLVLDRIAAMFDVDETFLNESSLKICAKKIEHKYISVDGDSKSYKICQNVFSEALVNHLLINHDETAIKILPIDILVAVCNSQPFGIFAITTKHYRCVAKRFMEIIQAEDPNLLMMSCCSVWDKEEFSDIALTFIGVDNFFIPNKRKSTLMASLAQANRSCIIEKVVNYVTQYRHDILKDKSCHLAEALKSACRYGHGKTIDHLLRCCERIDDTVMCAGAEGGDYEILQMLVKLGGQVFDRKGEVLGTLCKCGHFETFKRLLENNSGKTLLSKKGHKGNTILHSAVSATHTSFVAELIAMGANPDICNRDGLTSLHVAAIYGRLNTVKLLHAKNKSLLSMTDNYGFTAAHYAAREGYLPVLQYLVEKEVRGDIKVYGSNTILHLAAYNGHTRELKFLWNKYPSLITAQNNESFTAPQLAARMGHVETLQFCIDAGIKPDTRTVDGRTFLHLAAYNGQLAMVKYLCKHHPQIVDMIDTDGNTVAHDAGASGSVPVLDYLLQGFIDMKSLSQDSCTILHDACYYGRLEISMYLVDRCPELLSMQTHSGYTPCHGAALGGFVELYEFLVSKGADAHALSNDKSSSLHEAAFSGKLDMVKYLCSSFPELIACVNKMDYTATHFAAQEGHLELFSFLLSETKDPLRLTSEKQTYLHIAAYNNRLDVAKYLCENYPTLVLMSDSTGATALHYAARGGSIEICNYLIEQIKSPAMKTDNGSTILHLACYDGKLQLVKYLCQHYPQLVYETDSSGHNAAHYAAGSSSVELLEFVLQTGIDPMSRTENGSTILLKAAYSGNLDVVQYICTEYPMMIQLADNFGCNLLHYAVSAGNIDVLQYALSSAIDPMGQTSDGHTLLHIAAFHGQVHLVKYLCETYPNMRNVPDNKDLSPEHYALEGQQDHVIQYLTSKYSKSQKISRKKNNDDGIDEHDGFSERNGVRCQLCSDCIVTCFKCQCSREYTLKFIRTLWSKFLGLVCAFRRN